MSSRGRLTEALADTATRVVSIVIQRFHTHTGILWGPLASLTGVVLDGLVMLVTATVERGGGRFDASH